LEPYLWFGFPFGVGPSFPFLNFKSLALLVLSLPSRSGVKFGLLREDKGGNIGSLGGFFQDSFQGWKTLKTCTSLFNGSFIGKSLELKVPPIPN